MKHLGTQPIETGRLLLRPFTIEDAPAMYRNWAGDERVARHMFWQPFESEQAVREELEGWVQSYQNDDFYRWAIVEKASGEVIGSLGLGNSGSEKSPRWEPAYNIGHDFWGHGYTAEALVGAIEFFWDTGIDRLYAAHSKNNPGSGRVLEKAGFEQRGEDSYQLPDGTLEPALAYRLKRSVPRHVGTRVLKTARLVLRPFTMDDLQPMYSGWCHDEEVTRYMRWSPHVDIEETRGILENWVEGYNQPDSYNWAITTRDGKLIGSIGIVPFDEEEGYPDYWQPGYCLAKAHWCKGYASEALLAVMDEFVRCTGITKLFCCHAVGNEASGKVMEKAGFVFHHDGSYPTFAGDKIFAAKFYRYQP